MGDLDVVNGSRLPSPLDPRYPFSMLGGAGMWRTMRFICHQRSTIAGPSLVKVDVEGAELSVLRGASGFLTEPRNETLVELHPWLVRDGETERVVETLQGAGFEVSVVDSFRSSRR